MRQVTIELSDYQADVLMSWHAARETLEETVALIVRNKVAGVRTCQQLSMDIERGVV